MMQVFVNGLNNLKKVKFIHIAGTNGKGSIAEMLASVLNNTEYKVRKIYFSTFN